MKSRNILPNDPSAEYAMYEVDTTFHPSLLCAARRRIAARLRIRFAHIDAAKRHALVVHTLATLQSPEGRGAWATFIEAGGEVLYMIRNLSATLVAGEKRTLCRICLEDLWVFENECRSGNIGIAECVILGTTFLLGILGGFVLYPLLMGPTFRFQLPPPPPPHFWLY